jgi:hypothetical protein
MNQFTVFLSGTWHICLGISAILFLFYWYNHKKKIEYLEVAGIYFCVEGLLATVLVCYNAFQNLICYNAFLEKGFITVGAIGSIWLCIKGLKATISNSQPH